MADELTVFLRAICLKPYCIQGPSYLDITGYVEFGLASAARSIIVRCSKTLGIAVELASDASLELTAEAFLDVELLNDKNFEQMASRLCEVELVVHTWSSCDPLCDKIHHRATILSYFGLKVATKLDSKCQECGNEPSIVISKQVLSLCQPVEIHTWLMDGTGTLQQQAFTFTITAHGIEKGYLGKLLNHKPWRRHLGKKRKRSQAEE
ncbi:hypothetical protein FBULB1_14205 [Fusarium bulbicola]|nr:hypothetical protein FBULB1_14205 [Fusarium bulbicola]